MQKGLFYLFIVIFSFPYSIHAVANNGCFEADRLGECLEMEQRYRIKETRTAEASLTFKANIQKKNCSIIAGNEPSKNSTVEMGVVGRKADSKGALIPVYFVIEKCDGNTLDSIKFIQDIPGANSTNNGGKQYISTKDSNLKVRLYSNYDGTHPFEKLDFTNNGGKPIVIGERITACYARAEVGPGDVDLSNFQDNIFTGKGQFLVSYH